MRLFVTPKGTWASTKEAWFSAMKAEGSTGTPEDHTVNVPTTKAELMEFLTFHGFNALHPCGVTVAVHVVSNDPLTTVTPVTLDDLFFAAPLPHQLTLAAIALEEARMAVGPKT